MRMFRVAWNTPSRDNTFEVETVAELFTRIVKPAPKAKPSVIGVDKNV